MKIQIDGGNVVAVTETSRVIVTDFKDRHITHPYIPYAQEYDETSWDSATLYCHEHLFYICRTRYVENPYDPAGPEMWPSWFVSQDLGATWTAIADPSTPLEQLHELSALGPGRGRA